MGLCRRNVLDKSKGERSPTSPLQASIFPINHHNPHSSHSSHNSQGYLRKSAKICGICVSLFCVRRELSGEACHKWVAIDVEEQGGRRIRRGGRAAAPIREIRLNPWNRGPGSGVFRVFRGICGSLSPLVCSIHYPNIYKICGICVIFKNLRDLSLQACFVYSVESVGALYTSIGALYTSMGGLMSSAGAFTRRGYRTKRHRGRMSRLTSAPGYSG